MRGSRPGTAGAGSGSGGGRRSQAGRLGRGSLGTDRHHLGGEAKRDRVEVGLAGE